MARFTKNGGRGNHRRVGSVVIGGNVDDGAAVAKTTAKTSTVRHSAATRKWADVARAAGMNAGDIDAVIADATAFANVRGSSRVWDIDIAAAFGVAMTPDATAEWRRSVGIAASTPWPTNPATTPAADVVAARMDVDAAFAARVAARNADAG